MVESGWITQGPKVRELEAGFARLCGTAHAVATNTGTAALHVALLALEIGADDEVITTPLSCIASANPILFQGARPVFADVDPETYNLDLAEMSRRVTPRTKAILPVHLFGHPVDMDPLMDLARLHGLVVIEDASQATGALYKGQPVGGLGHVGCFSLYANKIVTSGEGGMAVTRDEALARAHDGDPELRPAARTALPSSLPRRELQDDRSERRRRLRSAREARPVRRAAATATWPS